MSAPSVSIVIRTFNEARHLPALFDALGRQSRKDFETVVVDSGSFDATLAIAEKRAGKIVRIPQSDFTFGHSLNVGVENSRGKFIAIISAHTKPVGPDWLKNLVAPLEDPRTAMCYGKQIGGDSSKFGEDLDFDRTFGDKRLELTPPRFFANNANSAIRKDLWNEHPFDETLPGLEDIEWAKHFMEKGFKVVYEPGACLHHYHNETWPQVRRRYYREGQAAAWIGVRQRRDIPAELAREAGSLLGDLGAALSRGVLAEKLREIVRFRYEKNVGTVSGIWAGRRLPNPMERQELYFDTSYRAVVIDGPGRAALQSRSIPALKPGEVLVRVAYQGVCATDIEILEGRLGYFKTGEADYPIVPGHEISGTVMDGGTKIDDLPPGTAVVVECIQGCGHCAACRAGNPIGCQARRELGVMKLDGGYADYVVASRKFIHALPEGTDLKSAALCEPLAVVLKGLRRLEAAWRGSEKKSCAVIGAGTIGHLTAKVLARRGHAVTVFDRNPSRLEALKNVGTSAEMSGLERFDALVEATGNPDALDAALRGSRAGACLLLLGLPYEEREFNFETLVAYDKTVVGSVGSSGEDFAEAVRLIRDLDTSPLTENTFPLERFAEAWAFSREGRGLKAMLAVSA